MLSDQLIKDIHFQYEQTRRANEDALAERLKAIYMRHPRLREIENELKQLGIEITHAVLKNPSNYESVTSSFEAVSKQLLRERAYLLTENDIPLDYILLKYDCDLCKDTGYLGGNKRCQCFNQKMIDYLYEMSNIRTRIEKENLNAFRIDIFSDQLIDGNRSQKDNISQILSAVEQYIYQFNSKTSPNMFFYGPTGQGKTFFCSSIAKSLLDRGHLIVYQTAFKLIDVIEKHHFGQKNALTREKYQLLFDAELLIIDDLGTEFNNSFTNTEIFNIINGRLLSGRPTIISTNLSLKDIEKVYGPRVSSRIYGDFDIFKFYGPDLRWKR
jgi:DNA replication protein DnaC